jgi:SOS response regulatory protein OraA/RecX
MKPKNEQHPAGDWGKLRSELARRGFSQAQIKAAIGDNVDKRNREQIADALKKWLKER